ncbi:MAG: ABC transporter substrate-binding protein [Eubacteriales bacterium]
MKKFCLNSNRVSLRFLILAMLATFLFSSIFAGCGQKDNSNVQTSTPKNEGPLKLLVWEGYDNRDAFKPLGIPLQASYLGANEEVFTKLKASAPGTYDLATIYQGEVYRLINAGLLEPIDISAVPNYQSLLPFFKDIPILTKDGKLYGVPFLWGSMLINYNADLTSPPKSIKELFDPKYKGKIAMPDDAYAVITTFARVAGFSSHATQLTKDELQQTMALLNKFKPQVLTIAPNYGELLNILLRKEAWITLPDWQPTAIAAQKEKVNVKTAIPVEGGLSYVDSWLIAKGSTRMKDSLAAINQAISPEAQAIFGNNLASGVVSSSAVSKLDKANQDIYNYDNISSIFDKAPLYPPVPTESTKYATYADWVKAWEHFKVSK